MAGGFQAKLGINELTEKTGGLWKALLAEFLGNLILNLFGCGSCINVAKTSDAADLVLIGLTFGLAVFMIISTIGHVSGGHVNPAVTAGLLAAGNITVARAVLYVIAQCAGAIAGSGVLKAFTPEEVQGNLGLTSLGAGVAPVQGFGIEFFLGFILVFVVFGVCDPNKPDAKACAPLAIGLTVTLGHLMAIDYTGSAMNPARAFGSAVVAGIWSNHWVYWVGPIGGGVCAALLYKHGLAAPEPAQQQTAKYTAVSLEDKELKRLDGNGGKGDELA